MPTIILVRVSMGLSFHDESFMMQASIGGLPVIPDIRISNPIPEDRIVDEERRYNDFRDQLGGDSDIQMVDR